MDLASARPSKMRAGFNKAVADMERWLKALRREGKKAKVRMSDYSTETTPPACDMTDDEIREYSRRIVSKDFEVANNMRTEPSAVVRAKQRSGQAL